MYCIEYKYLFVAIGDSRPRLRNDTKVHLNLHVALRSDKSKEPHRQLHQTYDNHIESCSAETLLTARNSTGRDDAVDVGILVQCLTLSDYALRCIENGINIPSCRPQEYNCWIHNLLDHRQGWISRAQRGTKSSFSILNEGWQEVPFCGTK